MITLISQTRDFSNCFCFLVGGSTNRDSNVNVYSVREKYCETATVLTSYFQSYFKLSNASFFGLYRTTVSIKSCFAFHRHIFIFVAVLCYFSFVYYKLAILANRSFADNANSSLDRWNPKITRRIWNTSRQDSIGVDFKTKLGNAQVIKINQVPFDCVQLTQIQDNQNASMNQ